MKILINLSNWVNVSLKLGFWIIYAFFKKLKAADVFILHKDKTESFQVSKKKRMSPVEVDLCWNMYP